MTSRSILAGPDHLKSAMGLKRLMPEEGEAPFQTASRPFRDFRLGKLFQNLVRRPASFGGAGQKAIQLRRQGA